MFLDSTFPPKSQVYRVGLEEGRGLEEGQGLEEGLEEGLEYAVNPESSDLQSLKNL